MRIIQRAIPLTQFAAAMQADQSDFGRDVQCFSSKFGSVDSQLLAVVAQARYFCWFEVEYEDDFLGVCRAIGTGQPGSMYCCGQVSPRRWREMNTYLVGVQLWLGRPDPLPDRVSSKEIAQIGTWLGQRTRARSASWLWGLIRGSGRRVVRRGNDGLVLHSRMFRGCALDRRILQFRFGVEVRLGLEILRVERQYVPVRRQCSLPSVGVQDGPGEHYAYAHVVRVRLDATPGDLERAVELSGQPVRLRERREHPGRRVTRELGLELGDSGGEVLRLRGHRQCPRARPPCGRGVVTQV